MGQAAAENYQLSDDLLARAMWYICNERHIFHRYCVLDDSPAFPLFFMDRVYDWQYEKTGEAPIISRFNGFMELAFRESMVERRYEPKNLRDELRRLTSENAHLSLPLSYVHEDGTRYVSPSLVEAIDDDDVIYLTRTGSEHNSFRRPVPLADVLGKVAVDEDGLVEITEVHPSPTIERLLSGSPLETFRMIFAEYGFRWYGPRLYRYHTPVQVGVTALDTLLDEWRTRTDEIVAAGTLLMFDQLRLNKHLQNRFQPTQQALEYIAEEPGISAAMGPHLTVRAKDGWKSMDKALSDIMKFSSLLVRRPERDVMDLYIKYLTHLRDVTTDYQQVILDIQQELAG